MIKKRMLACLFSVAALLVLAFSISAQATAPIAKIQAMLAKPDILCGRFDQTKQLVGISKPLHSNGRFCVVANKGVLWQTLQPFPNTLRLTRNEISQMQGSHTTMQLDAKQEPVVRTINSVLFSLLAGDFTQLDKLFQMNGAIENNQWQVALTARDAALAKAIGTITLAGNRYVRDVSISEANGDRTHIVFSAITSGKASMSKADEALFEQTSQP